MDKINKIFKQKPRKRARQRNKAAVEGWQEQTLPDLKKGHKQKAEPSFT